MLRVTSESDTRNGGDQSPRNETKTTKQNQNPDKRTRSTPPPPHPSAFSLSVSSTIIVDSFFLFHLSKMPFPRLTWYSFQLQSQLRGRGFESHSLQPLYYLRKLSDSRPTKIDPIGSRPHQPFNNLSQSTSHPIPAAIGKSRKGRPPQVLRWSNRHCPGKSLTRLPIGA